MPKKFFKKTLSALLSLSLASFLAGCSSIHKAPENLDRSLEEYRQMCSQVQKPKEDEKPEITFPNVPESFPDKDSQIGIDFNKHQKPFHPDRFYISLQAPVAYSLSDEKSMLKKYNRLISILGFGKHGEKITSFSDRRPDQNAYLGVGFENDTKLMPKEYGKLSFKSGIVYGKDTVENHIHHKFSPLTLDVDITDRLFGADFSFLYEPKLHPEKSEINKTLSKLEIQPYIEGMLSYKYLKVLVDARLNNARLPLNLNSSGSGFGIAIRAGIEKHLPHFPENSKMRFYVEARDERISTNPASDNRGFGAGIELSVPLK